MNHDLNAQATTFFSSLLKPAVNIPKQVPLHEEFARSMKTEMETRVPQAMLDAMKTALRK